MLQARPARATPPPPPTQPPPTQCSSATRCVAPLRRRQTPSSGSSRRPSNAPSPRMGMSNCCGTSSPSGCSASVSGTGASQSRRDVCLCRIRAPPDLPLSQTLHQQSTTTGPATTSAAWMTRSSPYSASSRRSASRRCVIRVRGMLVCWKGPRVDSSMMRLHARLTTVSAFVMCDHNYRPSTSSAKASSPSTSWPSTARATRWRCPSTCSP